MDRNNDHWHYDLSAFNNLDQWKAAPCLQVVSFPQWLLPNGIYPSEMSAVITAALRDSQMKGSRWWSCSVFFTLTPSASPSFFFFFLAADLQPPFCHCRGWAAKALTVLFKIEGTQGTSPFSYFVERDKILTMHGSWIAVVSILRVVRLPRSPTV